MSAQLHPAGQKKANAVRLGFAGLGLAGAFMLRAAKTHPHIIVGPGADPRAEPRKAFARDFGQQTYADFAELCRDESIDAIYIASPHEYHAEQAVMALQHHKHVLVEKPLALTPQGCDAVIEAAERASTKLIVGHTHGFDRNIRTIQRMVQGGELGRLGMILTFNYTDFLYRPRRPEELDTARGGGILFNQVTHQIEIARTIGGGMVRSVRANVGILDEARPCEGHCNALLEFESGASATLVYSSYDFFDSDEIHHWVAEQGTPKEPNTHGAARRTLKGGAPESERQRGLAYGARPLPVEQPFQPHFGNLIVTCELGDLRTSPHGLTFYGVEGRCELAVDAGLGRPGHGDALDVFFDVIRHGKKDFRDARWGKATVEVIAAILQSARESREVVLSHQVPSF